MEFFQGMGCMACLVVCVGLGLYAMYVKNWMDQL